jgi:hypothetical protein
LQLNTALRLGFSFLFASAAIIIAGGSIKEVDSAAVVHSRDFAPLFSRRIAAAQLEWTIAEFPTLRLVWRLIACTHVYTQCKSD